MGRGAPRSRGLWAGAIALGAVVACRPTPPVADPRPQWTVVVDRPGLMTALERAGERPVLIDVTASWCVPCMEMKSETFADARVAAQLGDHLWLSVDVTDGTDEQVALQGFLGADALPRVLRYERGSELLGALRGGARTAPLAATEIPTFVTADELLARIGPR